jgi:hypothetical protein
MRHRDRAGDLTCGRARRRVAVPAFLLVAALLAGACARPAPPSTEPALTAPDAPALVEGAPRIDIARHEQALADLRAQMDAPDPRPGLCFDAGLEAYLAADFDEAVRLWEVCLASAPNDWKAIEALIQAHQALGDRAARDGYRERLFKLRARGGSPTLQTARDYGLDQFTIGGIAVRAFERFEPRKHEGIVYVFAAYAPVAPPPPEPAYVVLLQENPVTTAQARQSGQIGPEDSVYELELIGPDGPVGVAGLYAGLPTYDVVRARVIDLIAQRTG